MNELTAILGVLLFFSLIVVGFWGGVFRRAGYSRWRALRLLVPVYGFFVVAELLGEAGYSLWWLLLMFVPFGFVILALYLEFAREWPAEAQLRLHKAIAAGQCPVG